MMKKQSCKRGIGVACSFTLNTAHRQHHNSIPPPILNPPYLFLLPCYSVILLLDNRVFAILGWKGENQDKHFCSKCGWWQNLEGVPVAGGDARTPSKHCQGIPKEATDALKNVYRARRLGRGRPLPSPICSGHRLQCAPCDAITENSLKNVFKLN